MTGPYKDVRSLGRGLAIIEALSACGWSKVSDLAKQTGIDRATVYRLISTLSDLGYVACRNEDRSYSLTSRVVEIADGVTPSDRSVQIISPFVYELTQKVLWPSDYASFSGGGIIIKISTHKLSPMAVHRRLLGKTRPLVRSAVGQAILSAMSPEQLETALDIVAGIGGVDARDIEDRRALARLLEKVRTAGYASSIGQTDANMSAIAMPIRSPTQVVGGVNIVFFRSALTPDAAAERFLPSLQDCVRRSEAALAGTA